MAVQIKTSIISTQDGVFSFSENTGAYNVGNTTGWGSPNEDISNVLSSKLDVFLPDPETYLPTSSYQIIDTAEGFEPPLYPTTDSSVIFNITGQMLGYGLSSKVPDGIYEIVYTVLVDAGGLGISTETLTNRTYRLMTAQVECCLSKIAVSGINEMSGCNCPGKLSNFELGMLMVQAAKYAIECGNVTAAGKALSRAKEICNGCSGC